jgi:glycosyltransferase involved in cell wall biosynthesis
MRLPKSDRTTETPKQSFRMRILLALTYYRPHVSGLTIYVQRIAEELAAGNHQVTVVTSRYSKSLPRSEVLNGVRVVRVPIAARISKGVVAPATVKIAAPLVREHDVVAVNLPCTPGEAVILPLLARWQGRPVTATYHCDVKLPPGAINRLVDASVRSINFVCGGLVDGIVAYTTDYADHTPFLQRYRAKCHVIPPPVAMPSPDAARVSDFRKRHIADGGRLIGFAARFAAEKGVEFMLRALPGIHREYPHARVLFAGEYQHVVGEQRHWRRMQPALEAAGSHWRFLGALEPAEMATFFAACDVTVLPSINSTESFGLVQVESMLCGTPVVAADLPGVRVPVRTTGMGRIVPPADSTALAEAVCEVICNRSSYLRPRGMVEAHYSTSATVESYLDLFQRLLRDGAGGGLNYRGDKR